MAVVVWKYPLEPVLQETLRAPLGARPLYVGLQQGRPFLWMLVDPAAPQVEYEYSVLGTGWEAERSDIGDYVGTFILEAGALVFHVFVKAMVT